MFGIPNFRDSEVFGTQGVRSGIPKAEFRTQKFGIPFFGTPCFRDSGVYLITDSAHMINNNLLDQNYKSAQMGTL